MSLAKREGSKDAPGESSRGEEAQMKLRIYLQRRNTERGDLRVISQGRLKERERESQ